MDPDPDQPKGMIEPPGLSYGWLCFWLNMFLKNATILNPLLTVNSLLTKTPRLQTCNYQKLPPSPTPQL